MASTIVPVDTPQGQARFFVDLADRPVSILVLGHGAGGGVGAADLELLARRLPPLGITVARFEQPWRTAGRKVGAPPPRLDEAWIAALGWLQEQEWAQQPLVAGGRSAGARVACRTGSDTNAAAHPLLGIPVASSRAAGEVSADGAVDSKTATAGGAGQQGQLRHGRGAPSGHRQGGRHHSGRAARGWSQLPNRKVFSR